MSKALTQKKPRRARLPNAPPVADRARGPLVTVLMTRCKLCDGFYSHKLIRVRKSSFGADPHHVLVCENCGRERRVESPDGWKGEVGRE